ncbi:MAG: MFS transporter [Betaproteobacteria bacterium]|nr:MFS transporter [Betaproteobacteria bacterium]
MQRCFGPLFVTQFCGALNDNLYKNAFILMIAFEGHAFAGIEPSLLINAIAALFILPFLLFSITAGECADKWDKARITRFIKLFELGLMSIGAAALVMHQVGLILLVIFFLGCHSTFFGPVKFALLPQHLPGEALMQGNGWIEMGTFTAILLGTNLGGVLMSQGQTGRWLVAGTVLGVALVGYGFSRFIPAAPSVMPDLRFSLNPVREAWRHLGHAAQDRVVLVAILGNSWFWFYGSTFLTQFPAYTRDTLGGTETVVTLLWTVLTLAVGIGSLMSGFLARGRLGLGMIPLGGVGMTLVPMDLATAHGAISTPGTYDVGAFILGFRGLHVMADTALMGIFAGWYIVPLYVLIQTRSHESLRARMMGTTNMLNALFMVVASLLAMTMLAHGFAVPELFLWTGVLNAVVLGAMVMASPLLLRNFATGFRKD